jgi:hypothetical protein
LVIEALAIVAAAAVPGYMHVTWKHVLEIVIAVLIVAVVLEAVIALRGRGRQKRERPAPLLEDPVTPPEPEPVVLPEPEPVVLKPEPEPVVLKPEPPQREPRVPLPPRPVPPPPPPPPPRETDIDRAVAAVFSDDPPAAPPPRQQRPAQPVSANGPWKLSELERALRAQTNPDPELLYMIGYLRDYADAEGTLPPEFDELVRDAFGPVLGLR